MSNGNAICPHCGHDQEEGDGVMRLPYHSNSDNQGEFECDSCGQPFWIKAHTTVTWETFATAEEYDES